jgi:hypothetical protein
MAAVRVATAAARVAVLMVDLVLIGLVLMGFVLMAAAAVTVMMTFGRVLMGVAVTVTVAWFVAVHHWSPSPSPLGR